MCVDVAGIIVAQKSLPRGTKWNRVVLTQFFRILDKEPHLGFGPSSHKGCYIQHKRLTTHGVTFVVFLYHSIVGKQKTTWFLINS